LPVKFSKFLPPPDSVRATFQIICRRPILGGQIFLFFAVVGYCPVSFSGFLFLSDFTRQNWRNFCPPAGKVYDRHFLPARFPTLNGTSHWGWGGSTATVDGS